jgi:hypothetical protein
MRANGGKPGKGGKGGEGGKSDRTGWDTAKSRGSFRVGSKALW